MIKITALLPIKRVSERIPGKNFKIFNGKPLYEWILSTLLSVNYIDKVIINTDAGELIHDSKILKKNKVIIRNRKKNICGNNVSMNRIIDDDLRFNGPGLYLMTHATNPLVSQKTIEGAIEIFLKKEKNNIDSLFTVNRFQSRFYFNDLNPVNHKKNNLIPTQELDPLYEENSNIYIFRSKTFHDNYNRIGRRPYMLETPFFESVDIDNDEGWRLAEILNEKNNK